ncbi:heterokaryon incompatibility protein-domain-containing protein [Pyrenochaeta sp. MPI-SDFR-AT-0127]|nr:heterokaryon incompatibility protein-domain-containing protein [Pyrenochaeta sp. MPI-SDFR-AT-0127]
MVSVCATCKGLQKHLHGLDGSQEAETEKLQWIDTSLPALKGSAAGGCKACAVILNGVLLHHDRFAGQKDDRIKIKAESFSSKKGQSLQDHLSVEMRWKEYDEQGDNQDDEHEHALGYPDLKLEFFTDGDAQSSFSAIGPGRQIADNPLHNTALSTVRTMIETCLASHAICRRGRPTTLPKRVLDLLTGGDSKSMRLHESEYIQDERRYEHGEYVAFSHIWGLAKGIPKTTLETLQLHKKNIPWSTLPRAFQEAVVLTRALGFRWLWIDSLCLVQDDAQEKLEESLKMDEIFGNAFLTIAATSSTDSSTQPLFPSKTQPFKIQATDNKGSLFKINVREQPSHYSFKAPFDEGAHMNEWELPFNMSDEANVNTPLLKRGWPYVERLLSPRVLHFTKSEMILECREGYQCECGRIDNKVFDSRTTDSIKQEFGRIIAETSNRPAVNGQPNTKLDSMTSQLANTSIANSSQDLFRMREEGLQLWSYIITEFTARNITYDSDRLIAIASIAKALSPTLQSGYIAGQWTFNTLSLLWYPNESTRCRRPKLAAGHNVPSWSWASVEGSPIFFDNTSAMDLACRASFGPKGKRASAWSPVMGEPVELTAAMAVEVVFRSSQSSYSLTKNGISADFTPDIVPLRGEDAIQDGETLVCILVSMTFRSSIVGLVLKLSDNNSYRRVGRFECYECTPEGVDQEMSEDAETLFGHWFPEVQDMTQLDSYPQRTFTVV